MVKEKIKGKKDFLDFWIFPERLFENYIGGAEMEWILWALETYPWWVLLGMGVVVIVILRSLLQWFGTKRSLWVLLGLGVVFTFSFLGAGILIIISIVALLLSLPFLVWNVLAPSNRFFTFVQEGTCKIIVRADAFEKALIQWEGYTFDDGWNVVPDGTVINGRTYREPFHLFGGLRGYGLWPLLDVRLFRFRWTGVREDGTSVQHEDVMDSVMLKDFVYFTKIEAAEDNNMVPLHVGILVTLRVANPYKALFRAQDWLELVMNRIKPLFREYIAKHSYEELISEKQAVGEEVWEELGTAGLIKEFRDDYGIQIKNGGIEMKDITPPDAYQEAATAKYLAERDREKVVVAAAAEAERLQAVYGAIESFGGLGRLIRTLEALERSPLAASLTVQAVPGLSEVLRGVFGGPVEAASSEDIATLRRAVEALSEKLAEERD